MILIKEFEFDTAHNIIKCHGKNQSLHGNRYKLVVKLQGHPDIEGMIFDFMDLKKIVNSKVIKNLDHANINDIIKQPTAENIAIYVWNQLKDSLSTSSCRLYEVEVWETKTNGVVYRGEKDI